MAQRRGILLYSVESGKWKVVLQKVGINAWVGVEMEASFLGMYRLSLRLGLAVRDNPAPAILLDM